jgi:hypothetical protein
MLAAGRAGAELPPPQIGRITPERIEAARQPTGLENPAPLADCFRLEQAEAQGGDWCPTIFNQRDTAHYVRGTTLIWHILVDHAGGSFEQDEIDLVGARAALAKQYYRDHAPSNAWVRFDHDDAAGFYYYNPTLPYEVDPGRANYPIDDEWVNDACIALGVPDQNADGNYTDDLSLGLQSWLGWDNVIVVFQAADVWWRPNASVERGACQVPPFEFWEVYAHEWGHCFGSCDEYEENGSCNGNECDWICQSCYLNDDVPNGNCEVGGCPTQDCIMKYEVAGGNDPPCSYTTRNWAWIDGDASGLLDATVWNRAGVSEDMFELYHQGWFIHTNTNWGMVANMTSHSWGAIGVRARETDTNYSIDVYGDNNHRWHLASSSQNTLVNFVVGDFNHNNLGQDHIRLTRNFGDAQYLLNYENGNQVLYPDGVDRQQTWDDREVVRAYDVPLFAGESVRFDMDIHTPALDLGIALFRSNGTVYYAGRDDAVAASATGGPGASEVFTYDVPADDVYGLVVFANNEVDGDWEIRIGPNPGQLFDETPVTSSLDLGLYYYVPQDHYWSVAASRPGPGKNVRLRLFAESTYQTLLATSGAYAGVEFIAADYNPALSTDYVRVNTQSGSGFQETEWEQSPDLLDGIDQVSFTEHQVAKSWDAYLRGGQEYLFRDYGAGLDTGIYLMSSADGNRYVQRSGAAAGSNGNPIGEGNFFLYTAPQTDWYGFVSIKENDADGSVLVMNGPYYELAERVPRSAPERMIFGEFPETSAWIVAGGRASPGAAGQSTLWNCSDFAIECGVVYTSDERDVTFVAADANHVGGPGGEFYYHHQLVSGSGENTVSFDDGQNQTLVYTDPDDIVIEEDAWSEGEVVQVWQLDAVASRLAPLNTQIMIVPSDQDLDLGVAFLSSADGTHYLTSDEAVPVNANGPGEGEILAVQITDTDTYGIVVTNHSGTAGGYQIVIGESGPASDVADAAIPGAFDFKLLGANPTTGSSLFRLSLPRASEVESSVYDVRGRTVRSLRHGKLDAGFHDLSWDGRDDAGRSVGSGVFFVRAVAGESARGLKVLRAE